MPKIAELLLAELERESAGTRRVLERVPEGKADWKPHEKSMPMGYLATLVATMPSWVAMAITQDSLDLNPPDKANAYKPPAWTTVRELQQAHDAAVAKALEALKGTNDD